MRSGQEGRKKTTWLRRAKDEVLKNTIEVAKKSRSKTKKKPKTVNSKYYKYCP